MVEHAARHAEGTDGLEQRHDRRKPEGRLAGGRDEHDQGDPARRVAYDVLRAVQDRDAYANLLLPSLLNERGIAGRDAALATSVRRHGTLAVVAQRLAPVAPDGPFNYAFGVAGVTAWPLVLGTLIGSAPRAFAYTALGGSLGDLRSPAAIVALVVLVGMALAGAVLLRRDLRG